MSSKLFFVNIFDGINSLSVAPIAEKQTNIDAEIKTAYVKDVYNTDEFNSTNMLNNSDIKNITIINSEKKFIKLLQQNAKFLVSK